jgi:HlyD family secretion protein
MICRILLALSLLGLVAGCSAERERVATGYVEGEYVTVSAPEAGWLTEVLTERGKSVKMGDPVFTLDAEVQVAQRNQASAALLQARAQLANLQKGRRPDELDALEAASRRAKVALSLAESEYQRAKSLRDRQVVSQSFLDARQTQLDAAREDLKVAQANLALAGKGARDDEISAARAAVQSAQASLTRAEYLLEQRRIHVKVDGRVEDTYRNPGEFVPAGGAVLQILPPGSIRLRFFVPEQLRARIKPGTSVKVRCDGCPEGLKAKITYLSTTAEYTPPVIYSVGAREKLVWLVEAKPDAGVHLSPGQPVDVVLP